jgi:hypothetical protein
VPKTPVRTFAASLKALNEAVSLIEDLSSEHFDTEDFSAAVDRIEQIAKNAEADQKAADEEDEFEDPEDDDEE